MKSVKQLIADYKSQSDHILYVSDDISIQINVDKWGGMLPLGHKGDAKIVELYNLHHYQGRTVAAYYIPSENRSFSGPFSEEYVNIAQ